MVRHGQRFRAPKKNAINHRVTEDTEKKIQSNLQNTELQQRSVLDFSVYSVTLWLMLSSRVF
jgi:hypothetical protein